MPQRDKQHIGEVLDVLATALEPFVMAQMQARYGESWMTRTQAGSRYVDAHKPLDAYALLKIVQAEWNAAFASALPRTARHYVETLDRLRNAWAHQKPEQLDWRDADRASESARALSEHISRTFAPAGPVEAQLSNMREAFLREHFSQSQPPTIMRTRIRTPDLQPHGRWTWANQAGTDDRWSVGQVQLTTARLTCCCWTDETTIVASGFDGSVYRCDPRDRHVSSMPLRPSIVRCLTPCGEGVLVVGDDDGQCTALEFAAPVAADLCRCPGSVFDVAISPDRQLMISADGAGDVWEWGLHADVAGSGLPTLARRLRLLHKHAGAAFNVVFEPRSSRCYSVGADGLLLMTELESGRSEHARLHDGALFGLASDPDSNVLVAGDDRGRVHVIASDGATRHMLGHTHMIRTVACWQGHGIVTGGKDGTVRLWDVASGKAAVILDARDYVYHAAVSPDRSALAVVDGSGTLSVLMPVRPDDAKAHR